MRPAAFLAVALALSPLVLGGVAIASSPEAEALVTQGAALLKEGRDLEAYKTMKKALEVLAPALRLTVLRSVLVKDGPIGSGIYEPHGSNRYLTGERILLYGEAVGFSTKIEDGRHKISLTFDYVLTDAQGEILAGKRSFGIWEQESWNPISETFFYLSYEFTGLNPGIYDLETIIRDSISGEEATLTVPIEIIAPPEGGGRQ